METELLSADQRETLAQLAETANEKLETAAQNAVNQAFNLGCTVSLLPGVLVILLAYLFSRASLVTAIVAAIFVAMAGLGFANLAAFVARSRTIDRTYQRDVKPEIERTLRRIDLTRPSFDEIAVEVLPQRAVLRNYCIPPASSPPAVPTTGEADEIYPTH